MIILNKILETDIYEYGESICDLSIQLAENIRVERRTYVKLLTILGVIVVSIEVVFTLFRVFFSFSVDILYEISLVNNLFDFDLDKKLIKLKKKNNQKEETNSIMRNEEPNIYSLKKPKKISNYNNISINIDKELGTEKRIKEETTRANRLTTNDQSPLVYKFEKKSSGFKGRYSRVQLNSFYKISNTNNNSRYLKKKNPNNNIEINEMNELGGYDINSINNEQNEQTEGNRIRKVKIARKSLGIFRFYMHKKKKNNAKCFIR